MPLARLLAVLSLVTLPAGLLAAAPTKPNIVYVLCDDLGYGDVSCLNPASKIHTPQIDSLARAGMIFTDAHSGSAVCTPTRYGIMTGRYSWRTKLQQGVLQGYSPRLIAPDRLTVAGLLEQHGYATGCVGKWHLGIGDEPTLDYSKPLTGGPTSVGFGSYFGIAASLDMKPYVFIKDTSITAPLTGTVEDSPAPKYWCAGPIAEGFAFENVLPEFTRQAVAFVERQSADRPFFLYLPLASPHTPIVPSSSWQGKNSLGSYADFVLETDDAIGQVVAAIERRGLADNTLVVVTSDNGCALFAGFDEMVAAGHRPSYKFRGHKADIYEGGHRLPFIVRWPAKVKPGGTSEQLIWHGDLLATCAELVGAKLPDDAGEDSVSILPALANTATAPLHEAVVHHSGNGAFAIRAGQWKLCFCPGSGGWSFPRPIKDDTRKLPQMQLFDLASDIGEQRNVVAEHPDVVARLTKLLEQYVSEGRSTPGATQANDAPIDIRRGIKMAQKAKNPKPAAK